MDVVVGLHGIGLAGHGEGFGGLGEVDEDRLQDDLGCVELDCEAQVLRVRHELKILLGFPQRVTVVVFVRWQHVAGLCGRVHSTLELHVMQGRYFYALVQRCTFEGVFVFVVESAVLIGAGIGDEGREGVGLAQPSAVALPALQSGLVGQVPDFPSIHKLSGVPAGHRHQLATCAPPLGGPVHQTQDLLVLVLEGGADVHHSFRDHP